MQRGGYGVLAHHNSYDTPEKMDPKSLRDMMVMNAAFAYFVAAAGPAEKRWMAEVALTRGYQQVAASVEKTLDQIAVENRSGAFGPPIYQGRERVDYSIDRESQAVRSAAEMEERSIRSGRFRQAAESAHRASHSGSRRGLGTWAEIRP